jgi:hypothetical protein
MYRGSTFLLQKDYTIHTKPIRVLVESKFSQLWTMRPQDAKAQIENVCLILKAAKAIREAYGRHTIVVKRKPKRVGATDTLITKFLLGTTGCTVACDRFFIDGFRRAGFAFSKFNERFLNEVMDFCQDNESELLEVQIKISAAAKIRYPLMKLVDMYFWEIGREEDLKRRRAQT